MNKIILLLGFVCFLVLPFISADMIIPGFHEIPIVNNITNFNEFPDYYFLTICKNPMPRASIIQDGIIGDCYKYSELSVYAVKKSDFNEPYNQIINLSYEDEDLVLEYLNSSIFKEVLSNVEHYMTVADSSTQESIINYYNIDINLLKNEPDNRKIERNNLRYYYLIATIVALIIIAIILIRRSKKNAAHN